MHVHEKSWSVRSSKNSRYEKPYCVTGAMTLTGLEQAPKGICTDRITGTRKGNGYFPMESIG